MNENKVGKKKDPELAAISAILDSLKGLDGDSIQRVLDYVLERLSINTSSKATKSPTVSAASQLELPPSSSQGRKTSIRDLKDEKKPDSANQMAALVAFYLSEIAADGERQSQVNAADLQKYFKQAGFRLPKSMANALPNAAAAGYFDAIGGGLYRLNPVGYNLVVHGLPRTYDSAGPRRQKKGKKGRIE